MGFLFRGRLIRLAPVGVAICVGLLGLGGYALAAGFTVTLTQGGPQPGLFTAALGDTVTFVNGDYLTHTVVDRSVGLQSPALGPGQSWAYVLTTSGRHTYSQEGKPTGLGQIDVQRTGTVTLKTSRRSVAFGTGAVLSGTTSLPSFPVKLEQKAKGDSRWNDLATVTPQSDGSYSFGLQPEKGAQYRADVFEGELLSTAISVEVRPVIKLRAVRHSAPAGSLVTLTARILPAEAATSLDLMRYDSLRQHWRRVLTTRVSNGKATFRWRVAYGRSLLIASVLKHSLDRNFAEASSRSVVVTGSGKAPPKGKRRP